MKIKKSAKTKVEKIFVPKPVKALYKKALKIASHDYELEWSVVGPVGRFYHFFVRYSSIETLKFVSKKFDELVEDRYGYLPY